MSYVLAKLSDINHRMAIHNGNANERLASEAKKILLLFSSEVPTKYQEQFQELRELIIENLKNLAAPGLTLTKFANMQNRTAAKYIEMLYLIEDELKD